MDSVLKLLITEACESDPVMEYLEAICVAKQFSPLYLVDLLEPVPEPDVYVDKYFEEVVPKYSNSSFKSHFRMTRETMQFLIEEVGNVFNEQGPNVSQMAVSLPKKIHVTIWMLANYAVTFRECSTLFGLSTGTVHFAFLQICTALNMLRTQFIKWPSQHKAEEMAENTREKTNFPGVIGSIDGSHIKIKQPSTENAYDYYNRKQFYSVILQGVCDSSLKFTDVFVGMPGKVHDARVFRLSPLSKHIEAGLIPKHLHLLGDSAYGLHENVLTPYRDNGHLTIKERRYNAKHAAIRSSIERAFGLLKNKFRRLRYLDMRLMGEIPVVVTACCVLHNFILIHEGFEENEDEYDNLDYVPDSEEHEQTNIRTGDRKRRNITNLLSL